MSFPDAERWLPPLSQALSLLERTGWLAWGVAQKYLDAVPTHTWDDLKSLVSVYQLFHGLEADGWCGPQTYRSLSEHRTCGLPDVLEDSLGLRKWANPNVSWTIADGLANVAANDMKDAFELAWRQWAAVCGIRPIYKANDRTANVLVTTGRIDGPGGTLAWSELPGPSTTQCTQKYDTGETWVITANPGRLQIDLVAVACHEIGHVIGLPHLAAGSLMQPTYQGGLRTPQALDVQQAVERYGPSTTEPPAPPPVIPAAFPVAITVKADGNVTIPGFRVTRLAAG